MKERNIIETKDKNGKLLFKIPLGKAGEEYAEIEAAEYHRLRELGFSGKWSKGFNDSVKAPCRLS